MTNHTSRVRVVSPDDGRVHYVGKTFKITDRFKQHVALARRRVGYGPHCAPTNRRERWLCDLARRDLEPILAILDEVPVADRGRAAFEAADLKARDLEAAWIGRLQNVGHPLTNFNSDACGNSRDLISAAAERGRNLALSLGESL
jgi:hypothetical protein